MKRSFLRILPLAVAVLLATSCSKDENSDSNIVVNGGQEIVVNQEKCISVTGAVDKKSSVSKLSCDGTTFSFDGGETIKFSGEGGKIHGETTVDADGNFTVDLYYPAEKKVTELDQVSLTATIGSKPTNVRGSYDSFDDAAKDVYETGETSIQVLTGIDGNSHESYYVSIWQVQMNVEVAFVKNEKTETIKVQVGSNAEIDLAAGKICIVPSGVKITADGKTKNSTEAGKIYTIVAPVAATGIAIENKPTKEIVWGNNAFTLTAAVEPANATDPITWTCTTNNAVFINNNEEQVATINGIQCSVLVTGTGSVSITATVGDFSDTYTFTVSADYVDLSGDGSLYYYTKEKGDGASYYWSDRSSNLPDGARVAEASELGALMDDNFDHTNSGGEKPLIDVINKNGSGAKITVRTGMNYWSNTQYYENGYPMYEGVFVQFYFMNNTYSQAGYAWTSGYEQKPIILVRDAN